jgi:hypothetical protein
MFGLLYLCSCYAKLDWAFPSASLPLESSVVISLVLSPMIANSRDCAELPLQNFQRTIQEFLAAKPLSFLSRLNMML